ncbi:MAG: YceI family protein [Bergeyella sp.]|nr:YceI family protein [Bergeyella sp.]
MKTMTILAVSLLATTRLSFTGQKGAEQGKVEFSIKKALSTVKGQFKKFDYKIKIDESGSGTISGTAEIASVVTNSAMRDRHLQNEKWFYAKRFPQIVIQSHKISRQKEGEYIGTFEIKIKGKSQTKDIPFTIITDGNKKTLISTFKLSIGSFDIGGGFVGYLVGDEVTVNLNLPF